VDLDLDLENGTFPPKPIIKQTQLQILYVYCFRGKQWILKYKIEFINVSLCVILHVFIMIVFEIYFYFNYVIEIEKAAFLDKIDDYFKKAKKYDELSPVLILYSNNYNEILNRLYTNYIASNAVQQQLLRTLLHKSCEIGGAFGIVLLIFLCLGLYHYSQIKWKTILAENMAMLGLLGFFEYLFFTRIIMNYNPVSDAELEYIIAKEAYNLFIKNGTSTIPII
jgi:hypothetical protein